MRLQRHVLLWKAASALQRIDIVAIGSSTGGPNALAVLLPGLSRDFPVPIVIVVSYADFITLLFAFFVVLYSSSQVDKRKVGRLALAIQVAFQELGVFDTSITKVPLSNTEPMPFANVQAVENIEPSGDMQRFVQPTKGVLGVSSHAPMKDIQAKLEKALAPEIQERTVEVQSRKEGVIVSLREVGFFDSGSATLRPSAMNTIDRLAAVVVPRGENLRIEGHTENVPIHNRHFPSNWELSTARATELVKVSIFRYHVMPWRLSAAGYAEFHPMDDNATPEGRARNRHRRCYPEPGPGRKITDPLAEPWGQPTVGPCLSRCPSESRYAPAGAVINSASTATGMLTELCI